MRLRKALDFEAKWSRQPMPERRLSKPKMTPRTALAACASRGFFEASTTVPSIQAIYAVLDEILNARTLALQIKG